MSFASNGYSCKLSNYLKCVSCTADALHLAPVLTVSCTAMFPSVTHLGYATVRHRVGLWYCKKHAAGFRLSCGIIIATKMARTVWIKINYRIPVTYDGGIPKSMQSGTPNRGVRHGASRRTRFRNPLDFTWISDFRLYFCISHGVLDFWISKQAGSQDFLKGGYVDV